MNTFYTFCVGLTLTEILFFFKSFSSDTLLLNRISSPKVPSTPNTIDWNVIYLILLNRSFFDFHNRDNTILRYKNRRLKTATVLYTNYGRIIILRKCLFITIYLTHWELKLNIDNTNIVMNWFSIYRRFYFILIIHVYLSLRSWCWVYNMMYSCM